MVDENKFGMGCANFDSLLADALDGTLDGTKLASFDSHKAECKSCALMFSEAEAGLNWLQELDEVEPPRNLVHNILAVTSGTEVATGMAEAAARRPWWERFRGGMKPGMAPIFTSRFAMSAAMAFFSVTMVIGMTDVKVADIKKVDLTPHGIRKTYTESQARVVRYYDNIRLVYEIESRVRDLKKASGTGSEEKKEPPKQQKQDNNSSGDPEQKQYQNYSREQADVVTAALTTRTVAERERGTV